MSKTLPVPLLSALLFSTAVSAAPISAIVVFGDSLSDQGNAYTITGGLFPPPPYAQRASNGPVAVEYLANRLGVALVPLAAGGTNFAFVGAATGPVTFPGTLITTDNIAAISYGIPALANTGLGKQVSAYLSAAPVFDPASTLFVLWGGPNDFFIDPAPATASNAVSNLTNDIVALYGAGARRFLVPDMPDLALTPSGLSLPPAQRAGLEALSVGFNSGLNTALDGLSLFPGIDITRFDTAGLLAAINANPAAFGMTNVTMPCLVVTTGVPMVCSSPDQYLFWDSDHPTTAGHQILGEAFALAVQPVPEPGTVSLLVVGAAALARRWRRRRTICH